jgi:glutathione S-transferase
MTLKKIDAILYHNLYSPPSRAAFLCVKNLNLDLEIRDLDISKDEQNKPEFLQINPMHQVPTLIHNDFVVTESRAILIYLASIAGSKLYPVDDLRKKTLIDSRLFFDAASCSLAIKNLAVSNDYFE